MKNSGEDRPVATPAPVPVVLVCEIAEEGQFQRWNAEWVDLVGLLDGNATLVSMKSGSSTIFDIVHSDDVAKFTASFSSLRAGNRSVTTVFRVQGNQGICVEMLWSRLQHAGEGETLIGGGTDGLHRNRVLPPLQDNPLVRGLVITQHMRMRSVAMSWLRLPGQRVTI